MINVNKETLINALPDKRQPIFIKTDKDLLAYCLRKNLVKIPYNQLKTMVNFLAESSRITIEQYDTLTACLNANDYSRVLNNRQVKKLIHVKS